MLSFPSNQFGAQEPGSNAEIKAFACNRYKATFPLFAKVDVNGASTAPVYQFLKGQKGGGFWATASSGTSGSFWWTRREMWWSAMHPPRRQTPSRYGTGQRRVGVPLFVPVISFGCCSGCCRRTSRSFSRCWSVMELYPRNCKERPSIHLVSTRCDRSSSVRTVRDMWRKLCDSGQSWVVIRVVVLVCSHVTYTNVD